MGIRFYCPNGHKLNVKTFQAGMRGICPYCGAKIEIPLKSTRPSSKQERAARKAGSEAVDQAPGGPAADSEPQPADRVESPVTASDFGPSVAQAQPDPVAAPQQSAADASAPADPLVAAADVVWYVRPASGGQFGPSMATTPARCWTRWRRCRLRPGNRR